eukprot:COSAG02_NODE_12545_length_1527_cov_1.817927_1_plen_86_part_10
MRLVTVSNRAGVREQDQESIAWGVWETIDTRALGMAWLESVTRPVLEQDQESIAKGVGEDPLMHLPWGWSAPCGGVLTRSITCMIT